ncbi:MAG TPA: AAA family ATPase [Acidobacteriaceae bacterium]|nr:AAA family ATPase [Acidobacteriaceae bacterium]
MADSAAANDEDPKDGAPLLPFPPVMLAVAGASGSGKTTLAGELARTLGGIHFSLDSYYHDLGHLAWDERTRANFDDPGMIEVPLLAAHVAELAAGRAIERPVYDFTAYTRIPGASERVEPGALVIVEGLFALNYPELRPYYQLSVFVDTPDDLCYARRLKRDIEERGRDPESIRRQYEATVRPCGLAFVRPLAEIADLVIDGADALDFKVEQVVRAMRRRGLLRESSAAQHS